MVDLPQHAGQIVLLRDILLGNSSWKDFFHINLLTPYLLMYGVALPLSLVLPITMVMKLMLTAAYIAFVFMCVQIRKHVGADPRLDWLFLLSFFGFAYSWGLLTFLAASPIGLLFILLSMKYSESHEIKMGIGITGLGVFLLESHGLIFLYAWASGIAIMIAKFWKNKNLIKLAWPYWVLLLLCLGSFVLNEVLNQSMQSYLPKGLIWALGPSRVPQLAIYALLANPPGIAGLLTFPALLSLLVTPWLIGLRPDFGNINSWAPFAVVTAILFLVPTFAFNTQFLYQRFALFLIPTYAWLFTDKAVQPGPVASGRKQAIAMPAMVLLCFGMLGLHGLRAWRFGQESAEFDSIMAAVEPKSRALALVFDRDSDAAGNIKIYTHYPAWYEAEKGGLIDFNFGWMPSLVVRYKNDHLPAVRPGFEWNPETFDWNKSGGDNYRYFFVRPGKSMPQDIFKGAACRPALLKTSGSWQVFEYRPCSQ